MGWAFAYEELTVQVSGLDCQFPSDLAMLLSVTERGGESGK
jgi:hypothetical protein